MAKNRKTPDMNLPVWFDGQNINEAMKILVFYVDKQYFNMVILFLRLRVRRELIIRRDGRAVEGTGLENRRCESIRGFESHSLRQLNFSIDLRKYPRGRRGSPAKGVGWIKPARGFKSLLPRHKVATIWIF